LPSDWDNDDWTSNSGSNAGGTVPEAYLYWGDIDNSDATLDSKSVDTTFLSNLTLHFKSVIDHETDSFNCKVLTRTNAGDTWTDVTPWSNPVTGDVSASAYSIDISSDIGSATQVRFEFDGDSSYINGWFVDDVSICGSEISHGVGGEAYPVNKVNLIAPWLALAVVIAAGGVYLVRRRVHS
jgi:hypothetical protein